MILKKIFGLERSAFKAGMMDRNRNPISEGWYFDTEKKELFYLLRETKPDVCGNVGVCYCKAGEYGEIVGSFISSVTERLERIDNINRYLEINPNELDEMQLDWARTKKGNLEKGVKVEPHETIPIPPSRWSGM